MWLTLDLHSETPLYMQIRNQIIEGILTKQVVAGEDLPSVRQLASDLGINMLTVNKAYSMLKQENFIQIHRQRGAVINPPSSYMADDNFNKALYESIKPLLTESLCRGLTKDDIYKHIEHIYKELSL